MTDKPQTPKVADEMRQMLIQRVKELDSARLDIRAKLCMDRNFYAELTQKELIRARAAGLSARNYNRSQRNKKARKLWSNPYNTRNTSSAFIVYLKAWSFTADEIDREFAEKVLAFKPAV